MIPVGSSASQLPAELRDSCLVTCLYQSQCLEILVNENNVLTDKVDKLEQEVCNLKNEMENLKEIVSLLQEKITV